VEKKKEYVKPEVTSIDSSEILEALGPASAHGGMSPGGTCDRGSWWPHNDDDNSSDG